MTRSKKEKLVSELSSEFQDASAVIVCDYRGMSVSDLEEVRGILRKSSVKAKVSKNSLTAIAMKNVGKDGLELKDMNLIVWGEDLVSVAKSVIAAEKENEKFSIKSAYIEGGVVDRNAVEAYSKLPGKEELLGMLLSTWNAPLRGLLTVFSGKQRELVTVLSAIKDQKESA